MGNVNVNLRYSAQGSLRPLEASLRGLNAAAGRSLKGFSQTAAVNVASPLDDIHNRIKKNKIGFGSLGKEVKRSGQILREHNAVVNANAKAYQMANGQSKVFMDMNRMSAANVATLGQRLAYTNGLMRSFGGNMINVGKNMQWAGRQVMVGLTLPLGLLAGAAVRAATEYDRAMVRIQKVTNFTAEEGTRAFDLQAESVRRQSEEIVKLGASMGFLAEETASTIGEFAQMGYQGAQLDMLSDAALRLSRVTGSELTDSIEATRIAAQAFDIPLNQLNETFARLNIVENNTALSVAESVAGLPVVGAVAKTVGIEIHEVNGLMAMMKNAGINAREGATALRTGLLQLVQEATDPTIEAFNNIGLSIEDMKNRMQTVGKGDPLYFFDELAKFKNDIEGNQAAMNDLAAAVSKLFGVRQTSRILTFLDDFENRFDESTEAGKAWLGVTADTEEVMRLYNFEQEQIAKSASGIADRLKAELNVEMVAFGENLLQVTNTLRQFAVNVMRWFNSLSDRTRNTILVIGGLVAALGPVTMILGIMTNAFGQIITVMSRLFPALTINTIAERAQAEAFRAGATAVDLENAALARNIALKRGAATAARDVAAAQAAGVSAQRATATGTAAAAGGVAGRATRSGRPTTMNRVVSGVVAALMFLPKQFKAAWTRVVPAIAKSIQGIITGVLMRGMAKRGAIGAISGVAGRAVGMGVAGSAAGAGATGAAGAAAGGLAAVGGPITAVVAALAALMALPIIADPQAFFARFKEAIGPAFDRLKEAIGPVIEGVKNLIAAFRQMGGEGTGLSRAAEIIGTIAGTMGGVLLDAITLVVNGFTVLIDAVSFVANLVAGIVSALSGDGENAAKQFGEAFRAIGRVIMGVIAMVIDGIAAIIDVIPGMNDVAEGMRENAEELRNIEALASHVRDISFGWAAGLDEARTMHEDIGGQIEAARTLQEDLIKAQILSGNETRSAIVNHQHLTDEQKLSLLAIYDMQSAYVELGEVIAKIAALEKLVKEGRMTDLEAETVMVNLERERERIMDRATRKQESNRAHIQGAAEGAEVLSDALEEGEQYAGGMSEEMQEAEEAARAAADAQREWNSALKSAMSEGMGDIMSSVNDVLADQKEAMDKTFARRQEQIKANFAARKEAIDKAAERELERIDEVAEKALKSLDELTERRTKANELAEERALKRVESIADKQLAALDEQEQKEKELEEARQRWFEQQKARIEFLQNQGTGNIQFSEALARGELAEASIIRMRMQSEEEAYMLDSYQREEEKFKDVRKNEIDAQRDAIKARLDAETEAIKKFHEAQDEAIRKSHEARSEAIKKGQEAEEAAIRQRLERQRKALDESEAAAERQLQVEREAAEKGFEHRKRQIENYLREWQRTTPKTEKEFEEHLGRLTRDLNQFGISGKDIGAKFTTNFNRPMRGGFNEAVRIATDAIAESKKWEVAGRTAGSKVADGFERGMGNGLDSLAAKVRAAYPSSSAASPKPGGRLGGSFGGWNADKAHSGEYINGGNRWPGLKSDETPRVLQHGEYVVRKEAVNAMGKDYFDALNNMKMHTGGLVNFRKAWTTDAPPLFGAASSSMLGSVMMNATERMVADAGHTPHQHREAGRNTAGGHGRGAVRQMNDVFDKLLNFGGPQGGAAGSAGGGWPPRSWGKLAANTAQALSYVKNRWRLPYGVGTGTNRGDRRSDHSWGKALDVMVAPLGNMPNAAQRRQGWEIANHFNNNPKQFGTKYVIWDKLIKRPSESRWRPYTRYGSNPGPTLGHYDHPHISFMHSGGMVLPGLRNGGRIKTDNTIANLHKGETVMTAPLTNAFEDIVRNLAGGGMGNSYHLEVRVDGGNIDEKRLAQYVMTEIDRKERTHGRVRVMSE